MQPFYEIKDQARRFACCFVKKCDNMFNFFVFLYLKQENLNR